MLRRIDSPTTDAPGIIFVTKGVYTIRTDTALYKTVSVAQGGILSVAGGVTLTLRGQLSAGAFPIFQGPGRVRFQGGMPALLVDWFGAKGDGVLDDAPALNWALQAANDSDCEAVFSGKQYALGSTLFKGEGTRVWVGSVGVMGCGWVSAAREHPRRPITSQTACMQARKPSGVAAAAVVPGGASPTLPLPPLPPCCRRRPAGAGAWADRYGL